jgi:putative redox protein
MECTVNWMPAMGMGFVAETGSGHVLTMDGAPDGGGRDLAPRPMETVLAGTGGCTAYDVVLILKRGRHDVRGCQVKLSAERAGTDPKVFTRIHMHFVVSRQGPAAGGGGARHRAVARALLLGQHHAGQDRRHHHQPRDRAGLTGPPRRQMRCAVVVITLAAPRISQRTGSRQHLAAGVLRVVGMPPFVARASARRWPRAVVGGRQAVQVAGQVLLDLALGLDHEAQAGGVAQAAGQQADGKGAGVPQRVQQAGPVPSSRRRWAVQARWSVSSRAAACMRWRSSGVRAVSACAWYSAWAQTSPTWFTRISAPGQLALVIQRSGIGRAGAGAAGMGRTPQRSKALSALTNH